MIVPGDAFKTLEAPFHIWIIITLPDENGEAVVVNLSSYKPGEEEDSTCVLQRSDYPEYIRCPTVVVYRKAKWGPVGGFKNSPLFKRMPSVSATTLRKIQQGALDSDFMKNRFQRIISEATGFSRST